jgi:hypothetical protein
MSTTSPFTTSPREWEILERAVDPQGSAWSPEIARAVLSVKLSPRDTARMTELAGKANAGTLSTAEETEIESYRFVARFLEVLSLRARVSLKRAGASDYMAP